jgi:hypothetical protein
VFWVHASNKGRFEEAYRNIADRLQLPGRSDPKVNVLRLVYDWLSDEENGQWLMILDNADDIEMFYPRWSPNRRKTYPATTPQPLASFLPKSRNGSIVITSRSMDVAERLAGSLDNTYHVPVMDEEQAQHLFKNKFDSDLDYDEDSASGLVRALDFLPLTIV